jgi:hypothetical protein
VKILGGEAIVRVPGGAARRAGGLEVERREVRPHDVEHAAVMLAACDDGAERCEERGDGPQKARWLEVRSAPASIQSPAETATPREPLRHPAAAPGSRAHALAHLIGMREKACLWFLAAPVLVAFSSCTATPEAPEAVGETSEPISTASCQAACRVANERSCEEASHMCRRGGIVRLASSATLHCAAAVMAACFKHADGEGRCIKLCRYGADGEGSTQEP